MKIWVMELIEYILVLMNQHEYKNGFLFKKISKLIAAEVTNGTLGETKLKPQVIAPSFLRFFFCFSETTFFHKQKLQKRIFPVKTQKTETQWLLLPQTGSKNVYFYFILYQLDRTRS